MAAPDFPTGSIMLDRYTLGAALARDPHVVTYEATLAPNRAVVVKAYDPALGEEAVAALRASAEVTRDLPRGSALEVLEVARDEETGAALVVTERSARPSLADLVQLCPLSAEDAAAMARSLARALSGAHARGLPHLGLKPTNVFVGPAPGCEVQVGDFAATLARGAKPGPDAPPELLPWLSPEQVFGGLPPGVSSDVFSAALVIFFALTGRSYWRAFAPGGDPASWEREIWEPHVPASVRSKELGYPLPDVWDSVFAQALDVDPARRPVLVSDLAEAVIRAAEGQEASPPAAIAMPLFEAPPPSETNGTTGGTTLADAPATAPVAGRGGAAKWIVGALLLAGAVGAGLVVAKRMRHPATAAPAATTLASPEPPLPSASEAAAAPPPIASAQPPASASSSATPAPSSSALAAASSAVDPSLGTLLVSCKPACDSIWVDGHPALDALTGRPMLAGVHQVAANLGRHASKVQAVQVRRGQVLELKVDFTH